MTLLYFLVMFVPLVVAGVRLYRSRRRGIEECADGFEETEQEATARLRREKRRAKKRQLAGTVTWSSKRAGPLNKERFDVEKEKDAVEERYRKDLIENLIGCLRQTVSLACVELSKEPWREVRRWQRVGDGLLDVMATVDNDPVRWRKVIGSPREYGMELNRLSFGLAALSFRPEGVTVPMLGDMQFTVQVPHPKAPLI